MAAPIHGTMMPSVDACITLAFPPSSTSTRSWMPAAKDPLPADAGVEVGALEEPATAEARGGSVATRVPTKGAPPAGRGVQEAAGAGAGAGAGAPPAVAAAAAQVVPSRGGGWLALV